MGFLIPGSQVRVLPGVLGQAHFGACERRHANFRWRRFLRSHHCESLRLLSAALYAARPLVRSPRWRNDHLSSANNVSPRRAGCWRSTSKRRDPDSARSVRSVACRGDCGKVWLGTVFRSRHLGPRYSTCISIADGASKIETDQSQWPRIEATPPSWAQARRQVLRP
jgi:hypothetical protein